MFKGTKSSSWCSDEWGRVALTQNGKLVNQNISEIEESVEIHEMDEIIGLVYQDYINKKKNQETWQMTSFRHHQMQYWKQIA